MATKTVCSSKLKCFKSSILLFGPNRTSKRPTYSFSLSMPQYVDSIRERRKRSLIIYKLTSNIFATPHCTKVCFASFLSSRFITVIVLNPLEKKLAKRISVHCTATAALNVHFMKYRCNEGQIKSVFTIGISILQLKIVRQVIGKIGDFILLFPQITQLAIKNCTL